MISAKINKVKRVVITSSVAAMLISNDENKTNFSVDDWSDISHPLASPYLKSKTLAEKAAWNYAQFLPGDEKIEVVTILPGICFGPNLITAKFSSGDLMKKVMMREMPGLPLCIMTMVDVRNVAEAHLAAV